MSLMKEDYKLVPLTQCCEILDSKRIPITKENRKAGPYPYYGANGIQDYVDDYLFDEDLVLLAEDGGNFGSSTRPIAYKVSGKSWVNNHAHVLRANPDITTDYLCYSLMFYDVSNLINGATRKKLTQKEMQKMTIRLRSIDVQNQIVNKLNRVYELIEKQNKTISLLDEMVKSREVERIYGNN